MVNFSLPKLVYISSFFLKAKRKLRYGEQNITTLESWIKKDVLVAKELRSEMMVRHTLVPSGVADPGASVSSHIS